MEQVTLAMQTLSFACKIMPIGAVDIKIEIMMKYRNYWATKCVLCNVIQYIWCEYRTSQRRRLNEEWLNTKQLHASNIVENDVGQLFRLHPVNDKIERVNNHRFVNNDAFTR